METAVIDNEGDDFEFSGERIVFQFFLACFVFLVVLCLSEGSNF
jgi:hypothetical protein